MTPADLQRAVAWDRYAAAALQALIGLDKPMSMLDLVLLAADYATDLLEERDKSFPPTKEASCD